MLQLRANAKINLYLKIIGGRPDGYHDLDMIMQSVDLFDVVTLEKSRCVRLTCDDPAIPTGPDNIAFAAAAAFFQAAGLAGGAAIHIEKHIPEAAGLGGGSADAAATLAGLNLLYGAPLSHQTLLRIAATLGADVPFSLVGGCQRARGIGERLKALENRLKGVYLIVKPRDGISTGAAFHAYDTLLQPEPLGIRQCARALEQGDFARFRKYTFNSLQQTAAALCPPVAELLCYLSKSAEAAFLTGSGSACVGLYRGMAEARDALHRAPAPDFAHIARPTAEGWRVLPV